MSTAFPVASVRRMYATLSVRGPARTRAAFCTVVDMIDMGTLTPEVVADVILGKTTIAQAVRDVAEVMADGAADCDDAEIAADMERVAADCRAASDALNPMGAVSPRAA